MKKVFTILLTCTTIFTFGQETKIVRKSVAQNQYEIREVLKSDKKVNHGKYELYENNDLKISGYYIQNQKDSVWIEYNAAGKVSEGNYKKDLRSGQWVFFYGQKPKQEKVRCQGKYEAGNKVGIWEFFRPDGQLAHQYDCNSRNFTHIIGNGRDTVVIYPEEMPYFKDGDLKGLFQFIGNNQKYPIKARDNGISGEVYVSAYIDENGEFYNYKLEKGDVDNFGDEAMRVMRLLSGRWEPAKFDGVKFSGVKINIPFRWTIR